MKHIYSILLTAITIFFGFIAVSANASVKVTWCDSLAYDGGGYWTVRVPVTIENKSGVPLEGDHIRVTVSKTDGTSALIGESVAGIRVADVNGVEFLFEMENEDEQRKREGVLEAGDVITFPAEADIDSTTIVFLYAGNSEAWLPPDIRDFRGHSRGFINDWLEVTEDAEQLKDGVRIRIMPAETRRLSVQRDDLSWIAGREWKYRVPLRVRNFSEINLRNRLFTVNTRRVNNSIGKLLGFNAKPALLLIDPRHTGRPQDIEGNLAESIRSEVSVEPLTERTIWLYISPNSHAEKQSEYVEFFLHLNNASMIPDVYVSAGDIETIEPQSWPLVAWTVDPLVKVFRQDLMTGDHNSRIKVYAARNSQKSFQIALRSTDVRDVKIQITALKNINGLELPVPKMYRVGYVPVDQPVWYWRMPKRASIRFRPATRNMEGWCDWWPDPLIPVDNNSNCTLQAHSTQPIWFDVNVPDNTAPGIYSGHVIIKSDVGNIYLPVEVKVWNLLLPESRHITAIYDLGRKEKSWYRFLAQYNVAPGRINAQPKFTYKDGQVYMDTKEYDEEAKFLIDELHINMVYGPSFFRTAGWFSGARPIFDLQPYSPEYVKAYKDAYRLFINHITEKGWRKNFVTYLTDEPRIPLAFDAIARVADMAKEVAPDVPIYVSGWRYIEEISGHITAWGIGAQGQFPTQLIEERRKAGDRFIYTTDGEQCLDTPFPACERLMPWFCFKYEVEAFEFWRANYWTYNPWKYGWHAYLDLRNETRNPVRYPNGDGYIIYPGEEIGLSGPVPSIRLVAVREGVDDYEIFFALNKFAETGNRDAQKALDKVRSLVKTPHRSASLSTRIMPNPLAIIEARIAAGEVLDRLLSR